MARTAIIIVGFRCEEAIAHCLKAQSASTDADFAVHVCENGGEAAYAALVAALESLAVGPASAAVPGSGRIVESRTLQLAPGGQAVHLHRATGNIGYAAAINEVLKVLAGEPDWTGIWILNPDTEPDVGALAALRSHAAAGGYGLVGGRLVLKHSGRMQMYGGRWRPLMARGFNLGLGADPVETPDVPAIEAALQYVSGASMYATRTYVEQVGPMEERYFLYAEEVDWCFRRGNQRLGYAHDAVILHDHGATIGSSVDRRGRSAFSVFLDERSKLLFTRRFYPGMYPVVVLATLALTGQYARAGAWRNFRYALAGWWAGLKGETGFPPLFAPKPGR